MAFSKTLKNGGSMKLILILVWSFTVAFSSFATEDEFQVEDLYSIDHEMFLACVATKNECKTMAQHEGLSFLKTLKDPARCPRMPKTLACIVRH